MVPFMEKNFSLIHEMLDALQCIKSQGIKVALLTNNWKHQDEEKTLLPVDRKLFNVVSLVWENHDECYGWTWFCAVPL